MNKMITVDLKMCHVVGHWLIIVLSLVCPFVGLLMTLLYSEGITTCDYSGIPDLEFAKQVKKQTKLPVIYSGNAISEPGGPPGKDFEMIRELLKTFDYVMIGRRAIGNPNIFAELQGKKLILILMII